MRIYFRGSNDDGDELQWKYNAWFGWRRKRRSLLAWERRRGAEEPVRRTQYGVAFFGSILNQEDIAYKGVKSYTIYIRMVLALYSTNLL